MDWFLAVVRIAGASFPVSASLVQLQAEIDRVEFDRRVQALEDPLANLHPDIPLLSERIYQVVAFSDSVSPKVELLEDEYTRFRKPLALLESHGVIKGTHTLMKRFYEGFWIRDPTYLLHLLAVYGAPAPIEEVQEKLEGLERGDALNGKALSAEYGVPLPFINALFQVYEAKGYGMCSRTIGKSYYTAKV